MRIQIFHSDKCPDCYSLVPQLRQKYPEAEVYNITESMVNLKRFLLYRDRLPQFDDARVQGYVGIPSVVLGGGQEAFVELDAEELARIDQLVTASKEL